MHDDVPLVPAPRHLVRTIGRAASGQVRLERDPGLPAEGFEIDTRGAQPVIRYADAAGATYGRDALRHLEDAGIAGGILLHDSPRFPHRGLMIDLARHMVEVPTLREVIDAMVGLRLNHLHLHLTDDQGWRLEIRSWPRLTTVGAAGGVGGTGGGFLTQRDYRDLQAYAAARHITLVPEIDLPGHTHAALVAYPELAPAGVATQPYEGMEVGFSQLDVHAERTYAFVADVLHELADLTEGPYLHIGGDECLAMSQEDYLLFARRVLGLVTATGKRVMAWHELGRSSDLPPGSVGQYWDLTTPRQDGIGHAERARSFLAQGGRLVLSPGDVAYLDHKYDADTDLGLTWSGGPTSLTQAATWEPTALIPGVGEEAILGVEATCFTETITTREDLLRMLLPRLAATAEVAWSTPAARERAGDLAPRLVGLRADWEAAGLGYERVPELG
ncbi:family 20 glycosylhydrolase [Serinibacter salmoneus]|nr:family 20 glycosylhydrolase [Serinibacter salmoneus]